MMCVMYVVVDAVVVVVVDGVGSVDIRRAIDSKSTMFMACKIRYMFIHRNNIIYFIYCIPILLINNLNL